MFVVRWIGFAVGALGDPRTFNPVWDWLRGLPTPIAMVVWVGFLPVTVGLWIWESTWATARRAPPWRPGWSPGPSLRLPGWPVDPRDLARAPDQPRVIGPL
jgi:hypothetical protein